MTSHIDTGDGRAPISRIVLRMLAAVPTDPTRLDPVAAAELRTTMNDLRTALNLSRGLRPDELNPATGYQTLASLRARRFGAAT